MSKRSAETFADHESVPPGAIPFFAPSAKRLRSRGGIGAPPSPSDMPALQCQAFSSSSDEMSVASDGCVAEQPDVVSAHHLTRFGDAADSGLNAHPALRQQQQQQEQELLNLLGVLTPPSCPDARLFLEQLAGCMRDSQLAGCTSSIFSTSIAASLGTGLWHAFAELNVVLARQFSQLPTAMLRGYHSFTRAPRLQLWARFAASQGGQLGGEASLGMPGGPCQLVLTRFLLEHVLGAYPSAACVVYTIEVPLWLRGWCARWGHPGGVPLRVVALFAFDATGSPSPRMLYVPCAE